MEASHRRQWFQFRLSTIFWTSLVIAVTANIAYRTGRRAGIEEQLARHRQGRLYAEVYPVKDLVLGPGMTKPDFDTLIDLLKFTINPQKWDNVGGDGSIDGFDTNFVLVVNQDVNTHRQIKAKLAELRRKIQPPTWTNRVAQWLHGDELAPWP
jgi:hypothetical protein